jgi:L-alanine-DL-glutamate epimerase-like enolase superfamily enzyme
VTHIEQVRARAARVPTDAPESDGTLAWDSTGIVVVEARAAGVTGVGWSYTHPAAAALVADVLAGVVEGMDALAPPAAWSAMQDAMRNLGRAGVGGMAISAVDIALWDLAARLHGVALCTLLGRCRDAVVIYGSGGFCSYDRERLQAQLGGWASAGIGRVKMKVGRDPAADEQRVRDAREAIGPDVELFVDANGAYQPPEAIAWAERFAAHDVRWLEEPVSSDDVDGLRRVRDRAPAGMQVAAGEYGAVSGDFAVLLGAVDVLQADVTRCLGICGFLRVAALCAAAQRPLSAHCAPQVHAHAGCAATPLVHLEYFHDHARIERMLFDGVLEPEGGALRPDLAAPGLGVRLRESELERLAA